MKDETRHGQSVRSMQIKLLLSAVMSVIVAVLCVLFSSSIAGASGGDEIAPFPFVDTRADKQEAKAMAIDSDGNIIVVGYTGSNGNDYWVGKYKADGTGLAWAEPATFGGAGADVATAVAVDTAKNIIVTGYTWNGTDYDVYTAKYSGADGSELWHHTFDDGAANGNDMAIAVAVDASNDIYVAGTSANGTSKDDFLIIKYPSAGNTPTWQELYDDIDYPNNDNRILALAVGSDGLAVTGYSSKGGADFDILTRKYGLDSTFVRQWRHSSTGSADDRGLAVRLDSAGNVVVAGYVSVSASNTNMYTVKYDPDSDTPIWAKTYGGNGIDEPRAVWLDSADDVYVTGYTTTLSGSQDYITLRYSSAPADDPVWQTVHDSGKGATDIPFAITGDNAADGGIFVTGYTNVSGNENFLTLKYKQDNGAILWQKSWNGSGNKNDRPIGIGLISRNVCVAGWTDGSSSYDFVVQQYDFGALNAPSDLTATVQSDLETSIILTWTDNSSNEDTFVIQRKLGEGGVYADIVTVPATLLAGTTTYTDTGLAANNYYYYRVRAYNAANGDSYYSNESRALTKIISYQAPAWDYLYDGNSNEDYATSIAVGSDDHPVVTGYSLLPDSGADSYDYITIKLNRSTKAQIWKTPFDSGDNGNDSARSIAVDGNNDVLVTGTAYLFLAGGEENSDDLYTTKYLSATGAQVTGQSWPRQYGTANYADSAKSIVTGPGNSSVVIGQGMNGAAGVGNFDIYVIKYNADGSSAWAQTYIYNSGRDDYPAGVAVDGSGNIFFTGYTKNASGNTDWFTAKLNGGNGTLIWSDQVDGAGHGNDQAVSIAVDPAGDAYVTGYMVNVSSNKDIYTIKYKGSPASPPTAERVWEKPHDGPAHGDDRGVAVRIDPVDGAAVVGGTSYTAATDSDLYLIRYDAADGAVIWEENFDRPSTYDYAAAMTLDSSGYIYLAGNSRGGPDTDSDFHATSNILSVIYDFEGTFLGALNYDGAAHRQDEAKSVAANYKGEAFIAGFSRNATDIADYAVVKQTNSYILVPAPLTAVAQADYSKVDLGWRENTSPTSFRIERTFGPSTPTSEWTLVTTKNTGTITHTDTALLPGRNYCYRVSAYSGSLDSRKIEKCVTTRLQAPTLDPLTVDSTTQITLNWNQVENNTGYKIERKIGAGGWADLTTKVAGVNFHVDTGLTPGTTYYYRISTNSAVGYSLASNERNAITKPAAPVLNAPADITNTQMTVGWGSVTGAATYTLQYKVSSGSYADYPTCINIGGTSCTVTGLTASNQYFFQVKAINAGGVSAWSNETNATAALAVPTLTTPIAAATITSTSMNVAWTNPIVPGANVISYTLEYKEGAGGSWGASGCPINLNLSCTVTGLTPNRTYYYRIKATNAAGSSNWSTADVNAKTFLLTPTLNSVTKFSASQIDLVWTGVAEATAYTVQQAACNDSTTPSSCRGADASYAAWTDKATNVIGTSYSATGLSAGTNYRYRVIATVSGNSSAGSTSLHAWTDLPAATLTISPASTTSLNLSWDQQPGETNYAIETGAEDTGPWNVLVAAHPINNVAYTHSSLELNTKYCYRIKAYSGEANPPAASYSVPKCSTTPPSAPAVSASPSIYESSYSVIEDSSKYWTLGDYWINRPVVITSGADTYMKRVAGSVNSAFYASPAFTTETINSGEGYVILHTVTGKATGYDGGNASISLTDGDKNWGVHEWLGYKVKIFDSRTAAKVGVEKVIASNSGNTIYTTTAYASPYIEAGDTYRIAAFFGAATAGSTATQLVHSPDAWGTSTWSGYYLMMTSGSNNGLARKITAKPNSTTLTVEAFPMPIATGDTYLIAAPAVVGSYFGKAAAGSTASVINDTLGWMGTNGYVGYYMWITSGANKDAVRRISSNTSASVTVNPAFGSAIAANDTFVIAPMQQIVSYYGTAAGSPGSSNTELVDNSNTWLTDWSQGYYLMMTSGSNNGQSRPITGKTATTLTVSPAFGSNISATDTYIIGSTTAIYGSGKLTTAVTPASTAKGAAKLTQTSTLAEFYSKSPGYAQNYNYGLLSLKDLFPLAADFDVKFDYTLLSGVIAPDASLPYLYLTSSYASTRFDFQSPPGKTYNAYIYRGRQAPLDNGKATAFSDSLDTLYDTRTMAGSSTGWKNWGVDQWKDYYLQMTSGANNQLVRKITANTANSITLESPFPNSQASISGSSAAVGNTNTKLIDSVITDWGANQWQNHFLQMTSGANTGQVLKIVSSDASSVTVGGSGFTSPIGSGDSYKIFNSGNTAYRINVIGGNAAANGNTQSGNNNTNAILIDSSDTVGSTLPAKNWGVNQWQNFYLYISSGPNIGQYRTITANTANTITVDPPFPYQIASNDSYLIHDPRPAAQAAEAYWVTVYEPSTGVTEQLVSPTAETTGKMRMQRTGDTLKLYTAPASGVWQLRRQIDLAAGDAFIPNLFWIYNLGRLPHPAGTTVQSKVENFQFTVPVGTPTNISSGYWTPEVGHTFRRSSVMGTPVELSWNRIGTAILYEVERCAAADLNDPLTRSAVGGCSTFTMAQPVDTAAAIVDSAATAGLTPGHTYRFRVRAKYNATDYTTWSTEKWITVTPPAPVMTAPTPTSTTTNQLTPTWTNVAGDNGYKLYWKPQSGADCTAGTWNGPVARAINVTSYDHSGLAPGTVYCYQIKAIGPFDTPDSSLSNVVSQSTKPVAPGQPVLSGISGTSITVTWGNVTGNTGYNIERKTGAAGAWASAGTVGAGVITFVNSGLSPGTLYYYRVSANSSGGYSAASTEASATTTPSVPALTATVVSASQVSLSWPLVPGATEYQVEKKLGPGGSWAPLATVTKSYSASYCGYSVPRIGCTSLVTDTAGTASTGLTENTVYCYQVRAWNSTGLYSDWSSERCVTTSAVSSQDLQATAVNSMMIRLDWTPIACAPNPCDDPDAYEIEKDTWNGNWVRIKTVAGETSSYTDAVGIDPRKTYRYRIRSYKGADYSPYSNIAVISTFAYQAGDNTCQ